jgi:hypothetical protein
MINKVKVALFIALMQCSASILVAEQNEDLARINAELKVIDPSSVDRIAQLKLLRRSLVREIARMQDNSLIIKPVEVPVQPPLIPIGGGTDLIILKSKINAVFQAFIDSQRLEGQNLVQAQSMELYFAQLLAKFNAADIETRQQIKIEIILFTEAARLLKAKLQLFTVRPNFVRLYFGSVHLGLVDEHSIDTIFTTSLHNFYKSQALKSLIQALKKEMLLAEKNILHEKNFIYAQINDVITDALLGTLLREEIIDLACGCLGRQIKLKQHPVYSAVSVVFTENFMDLIQQYFDLEISFKASPILNLAPQDNLVKIFSDKADVLMAGFLPHTQSAIDLSNNGVSAWASLFISKIILLKRSFVVRLHAANSMQGDKISQVVYFKHSMLLQDPQFNEATMLPSLCTYVSRYENLVMRFLGGQIGSEIDFYCEHYALLSHLQALVAKIAPREIFNWRTYLPRSGPGLYIVTLNSMIEVLQIIQKKLKNDDGIIAVTQNLLTGLLTGNVSGQAGNQGGITFDQLKSILSGGPNTNDTVGRLAACVSPLVLRALINWSNSGGPAHVVLQAPGLVAPTKNKDLGIFELLAQQNLELAQKVEAGGSVLASIADGK